MQWAETAERKSKRCLFSLLDDGDDVDGGWVGAWALFFFRVRLDMYEEENKNTFQSQFPHSVINPGVKSGQKFS